MTESIESLRSERDADRAAAGQLAEALRKVRADRDLYKGMYYACETKAEKHHKRALTAETENARLRSMLMPNLATSETPIDDFCDMVRDAQGRPRFDLDTDAGAGVDR